MTSPPAEASEDIHEGMDIQVKVAQKRSRGLEPGGVGMCFCELQRGNLRAQR